MIALSLYGRILCYKFFIQTDYKLLNDLFYGQRVILWAQRVLCGTQSIFCGNEVPCGQRVILRTGDCEVQLSLLILKIRVKQNNFPFHL